MAQAIVFPSNIFRSSRLEIDECGPGVLLWSARYGQYTTILAQISGTYEGYRFKPGDEGMFKLREAQALEAAKVLELPANTVSAIKSFYGRYK
jgi:hypothetical protein